MGSRLYIAGLCAILLVLLSAQASAYISLDLSAGRCYDDGSFSMKVRNFGDSKLDLQETRITARKLGRLDDTFEVTGDFDRTTLYEGSSYTTSTMFEAHIGNLNESGTYEIEITYPNCRYGTCQEKMTLERCPGFSYQCKLADLQITKCFERNGAFLIYFTGINDEQYEKINPLLELALSMKSNSRTIRNVRYPAGATVKTIGDDEYIMKLPLQKGEKPYDISLELMRCSDPPYFREISICSVPENDPNNKDQTVIERIDPTPTAESKAEAEEKVKAEPKELDVRAGQNRVNTHAKSAAKTTTTQKDTSNILFTLITISVIALWLTAALLVTTLLIRSMKK